MPNPVGTLGFDWVLTLKTILNDLPFYFATSPHLRLPPPSTPSLLR
jgi:hypothetical protein